MKHFNGRDGYLESDRYTISTEYREAVRYSESSEYTEFAEYREKCDQTIYNYTPAILPKTKKIIVFGDIHGDLELAINLLKKSKVAYFIDNIERIMTYDPFFMWNEQTVKWTGKNTILVQVGDQLDRCRPATTGQTCNHPTTTKNDEASDILIMNLFNELDRQAVKKTKGRVISLFGNHEIMNATGYLDYVSYKGIEQFRRYNNNNPTIGRYDAFKPGGDVGTMMGCTRVPAIIIGSNLFVHAGFVDRLLKKIGINRKDKKFAKDRLENINKEIRSWLLGTIKQEDIEPIINSSHDSMFWTRLLGKIPPGIDLSDPRCTNNITGVLEVFDINSIIIGHTPMSFLYDKMINSTCGGKVWRVDQGSSKAFNDFDDNFIATGKVNNNREVMYLEILDDTIYNVRY